MAYGSRAHLAAAAAYAAGLRNVKGDPRLREAIAIALAESGGNPKAWGDRSLAGKGSRGLWQVYVMPGSRPGPPRFWNNPKALYNPLTNAKSMMSISHGGKNWGPWTTYRTGAYRRYLNEADAAIAWLATPAGQKMIKDLKAKGGAGIPWKPGKPKSKPKPKPKPTPGTGGPGHSTKLKITPAKLRADRDQLRTWLKQDISGSRALIGKTVGKHDGFVKTNPNGVTTDLVAHNTIHAALQTTHLVFDEAFRLAMQDFDVLAKVLNQGADGADLTEAELAHEVRTYKDLA
jgi:hypothetical protein